MEKIISIDGRDVRFKSTGAFLLRYKAQFQRDALRDIFKLESIVNKETGEVESLEALDLETFYNIVWTLAKTADPNIPPPLEWLDSFEEFPLIDIIPELIEMILSTISTKVQPKKK